MEILLDTGARPGRPSRRFPQRAPEIARKADPPAFYRRAVRAAIGAGPIAALAYILFNGRA